MSYAVNGSSYTQDFDSLAATGAGQSWSNGSTITGWHYVTEGDFSATQYDAVNGTTAAQVSRALSVGIAGTNPASDRALGGQNSNATTSAPISRRYGVQLINDSGSTLNQFTLSYAGEQWRHVLGEAADRLSFSYQIFPANTGSLTAATGWTDVASLGKGKGDITD